MATGAALGESAGNAAESERSEGKGHEDETEDESHVGCLFQIPESAVGTIARSGRGGDGDGEGSEDGRSGLKGR